MADLSKQLITLAHVAKLGSQKAAAAMLKISPSVVSYHLRLLEEGFDKAVAYRSTRRVEVTPFGLELAAQGQIILDALERAGTVASEQSAEPRGPLRMVVPRMLEVGPFCEDVAAFANDYPLVEVALEFRDIRNEGIPAGFDIMLTKGLPKDGDFKTRRIIGGAYCFCASASYFSANRTAIEGCDISALEFIAPFDLPTNSRLAGAKKILRISSELSAIHFAQLGQGVAFVPRFLVRRFLGNELVEFDLDLPVADFEVYANWHSNAGAYAPAPAFVSHLINRLKTVPPLERASIIGQNHSLD